MNRSRPRRPFPSSLRLGRYGLALMLVAAGSAVSAGIIPVWNDHLVAALIFFPVVTITAWVGGLGPGLVAVAGSTLAIAYFWLPPQYSFAVHRGGDLVALTIFCGMGVLVAALHDKRLRRVLAIVGALRQSERRQATMVQVTRALTRQLDLEAVLDAVVDAAAEVFGGEAGFRLLEGDELVRSRATPGARQAMQRERLKVGESISGRVAATGEPIVTADSAADERAIPEHRAAHRTDQTLALMCVPIRSGARILGTLNIYRERGYRFDAAALELAMSLAAQAAVALENARLYEEATRRRREMETLARIGVSLTAESLELSVVSQQIVESVHALLGTKTSSLRLLEPDGSLRGLAFGGQLRETLSPEDVQPAGISIGALVIATGQPAWSRDVLTDPRIPLTEPLRAAFAQAGVGSLLAVPLRVRGQVIGVLNVGDVAGRVFREADVALLQMFADQAALAIHHARLLAASSARRRTAEAVAELGRDLCEPLDPTVVAQRTADSARRLLDARNAALYRLDDAGALTAIAVAGDMGPAFTGNVIFPRGMGVIGVALRERRPIATTDVLMDDRITLTADLRSRIEQAGYRSVLSVPLSVKERVIGALSVGDRVGRVFDQDEIRLMETFAAQGALALENARLYAESERQRREADVMAEITRAISESLDLRTVLQRIADGAKTLIGSDTALLGLREGDREAVTGFYQVGPRAAPATRLTIEPGKGLGGLALLTGRPYRTDDYASDPRFSKDYLHLTLQDGAVAVLVVPIMLEACVVGVLYVANRSPRPFTDHDEAALLRLAQGAAIAIKNAQLYARDRESEWRYRTLVEGSIQGIHIHRDWITLFANTAFARMLGYETPGEIIGVDSRRWIAAHDLLRVEEYAAARQRGEPAPSRYEVQALRRDGAPFWAEVQVSTAVWEGASAIQATVFDITERKQAEHALRESSEFQKQVIASAREGVIVYDRALRYIVWNPFMEELTGLAAGEVIGKFCLEVFPFLREQGVEALLQRALAGETVSSPDVPYSVPPTGRTGWMSGRYGPLRDADERIIGVIATVRDVTERRRAEEALRQSEEQLRQSQKMEAVGRLAGGIAHDFNNLLTVVLGRAELLLHRARPTDRGYSDLQQIQTTATRAAALTQQLLAFSRRQRLQPKVLDLNSVVRSVAQMLQRLIGEDITLVLDLSPNLGAVQADPAQVEQIIVNLAVNARDAMPHGGQLGIETANVDLAETFAATHPGARAGPSVRLQMRDTGCGMSSDVQAHIFEPFFTTKGVGHGTGLGLATVYGIVKQHEGYVDVESALGQGTVVAIYFKRIAATVRPTAPVEASEFQEAPGVETILLVEDEANVRELTLDVLSSVGYTVLTAGSPGEALDIAARYSGPIHLLLSDVVMPALSGPELAARLTSERPDLRVLYMSGYTDEAIGQRGVPGSGRILLQKPFTLDALTRAVREILTAPA